MFVVKPVLLVAFLVLFLSLFSFVSTTDVCIALETMSVTFLSAAREEARVERNKVYTYAEKAKALVDAGRVCGLGC